MAPLIYRELQTIYINNTQGPTPTLSKIPVPLSDLAKEDLLFWVNNVNSLPPYQIQTKKGTVQRIFSDASLAGWGASMNNQVAQGTWSNEEKSLHINILELMKADKALRQFLPFLISNRIVMMLDNITAIAYINKKGGTSSRLLNSITKSLWLFCLRNNLSVVAEHIQGIHNITADHLSRLYQESETKDWPLDPHLFNLVNYHRGPFIRDLFAEPWNTKCPIFFHWLDGNPLFYIETV